MEIILAIVIIIAFYRICKYLDQQQNKYMNLYNTIFILGTVSFFILYYLYKDYIFYIETFILSMMLIGHTIYLVKKYQPFKTYYLLIVGLITLITCGFFSITYFNATRANIETQLTVELNNVNSEALDYIYKNDNYSSMISRMYNLLSRNSYTYLNFQLTDENENILVQSDRRCDVLLINHWKSVYPKSKESYPIFNLTDYFTDEQLDDFAKVFDSYAIYMATNIKGHTEGDEFMITEIVLKNTYDDSYYTLGKASDTDQSITENKAHLDLTCDIILFNTNDQTIEKYQECNDHFYQSYYKLIPLNDNEYKIFNLELYADTTYLTLTSYEFYLPIGLVLLIILALFDFSIKLYTKYIVNKRELDESRNTFINAIAHEMKTPLAVIQNSSEMIKDNINPEKNEHYLDMIHEEAIHSNNLLIQMLTYTRTNDSYELKLSDIHLLDLVNQVLQHYEIKQELSIDIKPDTTITCDHTLMSVVIDNFISNAVRYSDGIISVKYVNNTFTIYNSGSHINEEDLEHIWEPLYKADNSRSDNHTTGMGLAISANILKLHHFDYGCHQLEDGIEFYFKVQN